MWCLRAGQSLSAADQERLGLPVFVKPARGGSSFGITKVSDWADLEAAVATAREVDPKVLVETGIVGREVECGVLEGEYGGAPEASVLAEITVSGHEFYDFEAKYLDDSCVYDIPAQLPERRRPPRSASTPAATFAALDCAGLARVDFFVTPEFDIYLNEINTMPGLHLDVDVPADVGGHRPGLPEAGQPAGADGAAPGIGPALKPALSYRRSRP